MNFCKLMKALSDRMSRGAKAAVLAAVAAWLCVVPVRAQGPTLEVAAWVFPPFAYVDDSGELQGRAVETVKRALAAMGYTPKMVLMPFKRCLANMQDGHMAIMLPCATSEERRAYMQYSDPVFHITTVMWKKGSDMSSCWRDYQDLAGLRIGVGLGYSYGAKWDEAVASGAFTLDSSGGKSPELTHFQMAAAGRIDMFISDVNVGRFLKNRHAPEFDDIYPCPKVIGAERPFGAPISRKYFEDKGLSADEFLKRFNSVLRALPPWQGG
ncbi:substrate-binding periplasmic protein [Pseudodesulfovibrio portus]|uniref:substrate-binding periplasmic protein n=1 Tax=Pseudodesulfovibrio portus TaxID=231439 RepID=UPI002231C267|nr:transporter substrate-binding domain-containing protein [Pseudodesulfovibrio portus]